MAAMKQAKRWCFTLNNFDNDEWLRIVDRVTDKVVKYAVIGEETGKSRTVHLQGYIRFKTKQRMTSVKKHVGKRAHVEICKGTEEENKLYCTKDGKIMLEVGVYNTSIGQRGCPSSMGDDVIALIDFLVSGKTLAEIQPEHYLTYVRYGNMITKIVNAKIADLKLKEMNSSYDNVTWKQWQKDTISDVDGPIHDRKVMWLVDENINYEIIESVKNGIIYNTKYQCEMRIYKIPHVLVFSNERPDESKLSQEDGRLKRSYKRQLCAESKAWNTCR